MNCPACGRVDADPWHIYDCLAAKRGPMSAAEAAKLDAQHQRKKFEFREQLSTIARGD